MAAKVVDHGAKEWKRFAAVVRRIASHSVHGHASLQSAVKLAARNARHRVVQCVVKVSIQRVAEWNVGNRIAESCAQKSPIFAQPRIVLNVRLSAPSQYVKWLAKKVLAMSSHAAMFAVSPCVIGIANSLQCVLNRSVP